MNPCNVYADWTVVEGPSFVSSMFAPRHDSCSPKSVWLSDFATALVRVELSVNLPRTMPYFKSVGVDEVPDKSRPYEANVPFTWVSDLYLIKEHHRKGSRG